ncbi:N-acetylglucosamine kinase [Nesterenkonia ebinurensis]|uniref:N-acetylglucosamine kinase n=1 Tax=Nesterenkonia ebinurensis TaxID=2608252 RepID=UPI001CC5476A|nr:BadF/BadG/BcrA/BcrD ATPase family protein [Nesterenkonia ebinurensis]
MNMHPSPRTTAVWAAVDAGQSSTKGMLYQPGRQPLPLFLPQVLTSRALLPQLAAFAQQTAAEAQAPLQGMTFGTSGLTRAETDAQRLLEMIGQPSLHRIRLTHDSVTSYLGAVGLCQGAVIASGTGVVTLAVGEQQVARVDGWGSFMGDAGSGFSIGREALQAVMRAYDGRGPATALTNEVRRRWPDLPGAYIQLQNDSEAVSLVASFARVVGELAAEDQVAAEICQYAAAELAHSVITALRRVRQDQPPASPQVATIGGVFGSVAISSEFWRLVRAAVPRVQPLQQSGHGVDGSSALFTVEADHPLRLLISAAERQA